MRAADTVQHLEQCPEHVNIPRVLAIIVYSKTDLIHRPGKLKQRSGCWGGHSGVGD